MYLQVRTGGLETFPWTWCLTCWNHLTQICCCRASCLSTWRKWKPPRNPKVWSLTINHRWRTRHSFARLHTEKNSNRPKCVSLCIFVIVFRQKATNGIGSCTWNWSSRASGTLVRIFPERAQTTRLLFRFGSHGVIFFLHRIVILSCSDFQKKQKSISCESMQLENLVKL